MKNSLSLLSVIAVIATFSGCGGGSSSSAPSDSNPSDLSDLSGPDTKEEVSSFSNASLMNLADLPNYDVIVGDGSGATNLKSSSLDPDAGEQSTTDSIALRLSSIVTGVVKSSLDDASADRNSVSRQSMTLDGDTLSLDETVNGNVSGTNQVVFSIDTSTGTYEGSLTYIDYQNSESNSCGVDEIDDLNGVLHVAGDFDMYTGDIKNMTMTTDSEFFIDDMIWKSGAIATITYNYDSPFFDDALMTMTVETVTEDESIGFKDYTLRSYSHNGFDYEFPVEGDIYIFTDDINGYFSVDTSYDHSLTPTKEDWCGVYTYSGMEKYVGENSTLVWRVTSTNQYVIEIDSDADGVTDINDTGVIDSIDQNVTGIDSGEDSVTDVVDAIDQNVTGIDSGEDSVTDVVDAIDQNVTDIDSSDDNVTAIIE